MNMSDAETEFSRRCSQNDDHNMFCPLIDFSSIKLEITLGSSFLYLQTISGLEPSFAVCFMVFLPSLQWHTLGFTLCKQIASDYHSKLQAKISKAYMH